jgi:hypothetical protein
MTKLMAEVEGITFQAEPETTILKVALETTLLEADPDATTLMADVEMISLTAEPATTPLKAVVETM